MDFHLLIPDWSLYHMMSEHIEDQAIDLAPGIAAPDKDQCFLTIHHVPLTDVMYHLNSMHHQIQHLQAAQRQDRQLLNRVAEHLAAREPHLAQAFGLALQVQDLQPGNPHGISDGATG